MTFGLLHACTHMCIYTFPTHVHTLMETYKENTINGSKKVFNMNKVEEIET